jgi:hypothetical protein
MTRPPIFEFAMSFLGGDEEDAVRSYTKRLEDRLAQAQSALELIASPKRPDGTWNRDREACRDLAAKTIAKMQDWSA